MYRLSASFICSQRPKLTWNEVLYGYTNQMIGWSVPVELAILRLQEGSANSLEIELAGVSKTETFLVSELLRKLAKTQNQTGSKTRCQE
ncbi:MAG: DUF2247 family protein, partial [Vulcanimicrobiota bacterium]